MRGVILITYEEKMKKYLKLRHELAIKQAIELFNFEVKIDKELFQKHGVNFEYIINDIVTTNDLISKDELKMEIAKKFNIL